MRRCRWCRGSVSYTHLGIIAVNTATFIGYKRRGLIGAAFSTLGMVFPSLVIITVIAAFIQNFAHIEAVQHAFAGIRVAVCVLILTAVIKLCLLYTYRCV